MVTGVFIIRILITKLKNKIFNVKFVVERKKSVDYTDLYILIK